VGDTKTAPFYSSWSLGSYPFLHSSISLSVSNFCSTTLCHASLLDSFLNNGDDSHGSHVEHTFRIRRFPRVRIEVIPVLMQCILEQVLHVGRLFSSFLWKYISMLLTFVLGIIVSASSSLEWNRLIKDLSSLLRRLSLLVLGISDVTTLRVQLTILQVVTLIRSQRSERDTQTRLEA
jgi:hypothetical protein